MPPALEHWYGPDARAFRAHHRTDVAAGARRAAAALDALAVQLVGHARAQRSTSASPVPPPVVVTDRAIDRGGRLRIRVGSPAPRVVVLLVPGVGTDLGDEHRLRADAQRVFSAAESATSADLAVVSWLGYDPPDVLPGALDLRPADEGAALLCAEVAHLRHGSVSAPPVEQVIVVGHSYGGVVAGRALALGMRADSVVLLGAPGVGSPVTERIVGRREVRLLAARAEDDPIDLVNRFGGAIYGPDPVDVAERIPTSTQGHGGYLSDPLVLRRLADLVAEPVRSTQRTG